MPEESLDLPQHELFGSAPDSKPSRDWTEFCPTFRSQGSSLMCTAYVGASVVSILEKKETGESIVFSPKELFARSGGSLLGNRVSNVGNAIKVASVLEKDCPTQTFVSWGYPAYWQVMREGKVSDKIIEKGKKYALKDMAVVRTDAASLKHALQDSPLSVILNAGRGYFNATAPASAGLGTDALHNVILVSIEADGRKKVFDSLTYKQGFDGFHYLDADYPIMNAFSFIDLPNNWREVQTVQAPTYFLGDPKNGKIIPFSSKQAIDYQMFVNAGYTVLN